MYQNSGYLPPGLQQFLDELMRTGAGNNNIPLPQSLPPQVPVMQEPTPPRQILTPPVAPLPNQAQQTIGAMGGRNPQYIPPQSTGGINPNASTTSTPPGQGAPSKPPTKTASTIGLLKALAPLIGGIAGGPFVGGGMAQAANQYDEIKRREDQLRTENEQRWQQINQQNEYYKQLSADRQRAEDLRAADDAARLVSDLNRQWIQNPDSRPKTVEEAVGMANDRALAVGLEPAAVSKVSMAAKTIYNQLPPPGKNLVGPGGERWTGDNAPSPLPVGTLDFGSDIESANREAMRRTAMNKPGGKNFTVVTEPLGKKPIAILRESGDYVTDLQNMSNEERTVFAASGSAWTEAMKRQEEKQAGKGGGADRKAWLVDVRSKNSSMNQAIRQAKAIHAQALSKTMEEDPGYDPGIKAPPGTELDTILKSQQGPGVRRWGAGQIMPAWLAQQYMKQAAEVMRAALGAGVTDQDIRKEAKRAALADGWDAWVKEE